MAISAARRKPASFRNRRFRPGIRELESLLGVTLVERSRRVVRFTPLGKQVVAKAHRLLREAEELSDLVQASGKPLSGELRMSVIPTIAPFLLPRMLPRLRRERPQLKLFLREETSARRGRIAPPRPRRLRAARAALRDRRSREASTSPTTACSSPSPRTTRAIRPTRSRRR